MSKHSPPPAHCYNLRNRNGTRFFIPLNDDSSTTDMSVTMTNDQLQALLAGMSDLLARNQQAADRPTPPPAPKTNFSQCQSRFSGGADDDVEAFINAIELYKDCLQITDESAHKGLPMLLDKLASTWYQGAKDSITTWQQAIDGLRHVFGQKLPAYKIYRTLFSKEQGDDQPTDVFISQARALLAQLSVTPPLPEGHKLEMVYGLLNKRIRERLSRDQFTSFDTLLTRARAIEANFLEDADQNTVSKIKTRVKCDYCKNFGHTKQECRKLASKPQPTKPPTTSNEPSRAETGRTTDTKSSTQVTCYGCRMPGFIRSQCPRCKPTTSSAAVELLSARLNDNRVNSCRALLLVDVLGRSGHAFVDTAATHTLASPRLHQHLLDCKVPYELIEMDMTLANGCTTPVETHRFETFFDIQGRHIPLAVYSMPNYPETNTLLGVDFISAARLVLDLANMQYCFNDDHSRYYPLVPEQEARGPRFESVELVLRSDEANDMKSDERQELETLLVEFAPIFEESNEPTPYAEHFIQVTTEEPIAVPPYRLSPQKTEILKREITSMLERNIIEESDAPYAAPVVITTKKDGSPRVCIDFRRLNAVTIPDRYPLPRIDDLLHGAKQTRYMSTIDLKSGYWLVPVREIDRDKTSFVTPFGLYRFLRMPFGLRNAPATFQRLIDRFRRSLPHVRILTYLDDMIVLSDQFATHMEDLRAVFAQLHRYKLVANRRKCCFGCGRVKYLGHVITSEGVLPDPERISAVTSMKPPPNVKALVSFLQLCSWFRRFIPNHAAVARPLNNLTRKNVVWEWGESQQQSFEELKRLLTTAPFLRQADPNLPYVLRTDASSYAIGACLLQGEDAGSERPVEYASRGLTAAERNYSNTERVALAVVYGLQKFRGYLDGSKILVATDHRPLQWLMSLRAPSGRLARWAMLLQEFDLDIKYVPGRENVVADALSRLPTDSIALEDSAPIAVCPLVLTLPTVSGKQLRTEQLEDADLKVIITSLEASPCQLVDVSRWVERGYVMNNGVLYRFTPDNEGEEPQLVIPRSRVEEILNECHDSATAGHYGIDKTLQRVSQRYYWSTMRRDVTGHVRKCLSCQRFKPNNSKPAGLLQTPVLARRFEVLAMDLVGPLPETKDGYIWVYCVEDTATRWIELFPLRQATAQACADIFINEIVLRYGTPRRLINDNGSQFTSEVMQQVVHCLGIHQVLIPVYHPAANPEERKNRDLKTQLAILVQNQHDKWAEGLPAVRFAMNTAKGLSTGHSPAYLCFGRELRTPHDVMYDLRPIIDSENIVTDISTKLGVIADALRDAREVNEQAQDRSKRYADARRQPGEEYAPGDRVLVNRHVLSNAERGVTSKFAPKRDGPYLVVRQASPTAYQIAAANEPEVALGVYHASQLRKMPDANSMTEERPLCPIRKRGRPRKAPASEADPMSVDKRESASQDETTRVRRPPKRYDDYNLNALDFSPGSSLESDPEGEDVTSDQGEPADLATLREI